AAGAGPGDDVGVPVAVNVAHRHADAAAEARRVGVEVEQHHPVGGPADDDLRGGAGVGPGGDDRRRAVDQVGDQLVDDRRAAAGDQVVSGAGGVRTVVARGDVAEVAGRHAVEARQGHAAAVE